MADFINTLDALGDDVVIDSIIQRTITEFKDNSIAVLGASAFKCCTALVEVDLPNVQYYYNSAFEECTSLKQVNLPELIDAYPNSYSTYLFQKCSALEKIVLPKLVSANKMFSYCTNLKVIDLPSATAWGSNVCQQCTSLDTIILRNTTGVATMGVVTNNITHSKIASGEGYIYVPAALVDSYKAATNWSTYADQFRALEDYTVDGTTTGELDETKI